MILLIFALIFSLFHFSGVAYIFNQQFFKDMKEATGVDLENIVYYKDETHYFVMCAKKQSLLERGVIIEVCCYISQSYGVKDLLLELFCSIFTFCDIIHYFRYRTMRIYRFFYRLII